MARGELTPTEATSLLQALVAQGKIIETDELVKRVAALAGSRLWCYSPVVLTMSNAWTSIAPSMG